MSKLGKKIIVLPKDSTIKVESGNLLVSGPKGSKKVQFNEKLFSSKVSFNFLGGKHAFPPFWQLFII